MLDILVIYIRILKTFDRKEKKLYVSLYFDASIIILKVYVDVKVGLEFEQEPYKYSSIQEVQKDL